ncbi:DUF721 domain-containing protein [Corynebacterium lizhenjunii]|uniref:DUF721 domain-containing protein n=2 Tax=Corynebacterium lizhenjunii TaxID=2709394 RepID=A0A7T0KHW6_9CORY|nr:DUF721 domain-containing protein [Corynebacterium lizhenjunii]
MRLAPQELADAPLGTTNAGVEGASASSGTGQSTLDDRAARRAVRGLGRPSGPDGRAPQRGLAVPKLGQVLRATVRANGWQEELGHGWVFGHWEEVVGSLNAAHSQPEKIEEQVLYISCDSSNWSSNLRLLQRHILARIAQKVGPDVVVQLRITGPKQHRNYEGPLWVKPQGSTDTYG